MTDFSPSERTKVKRIPKRGHYDRETIYPIVDEALICHVGFVNEAGQPFVIPTIHARDEDSIVLHGANASRLLKTAGSGMPMCVTVTHIDGLVLARSVFHHSMNYRSAVLFGTGVIITDEAEAVEAMRILTDHIMPSRWEDARQPSPKEINATTMVRMHIEEASAKIRTGGPSDDEPDYDLPIWAGVVPMTTQFGAPITDEAMRMELPVPGYVGDYWRAE